MDNFYQRLGVRALNDSTLNSSVKKNSGHEFMAFVANQSPDGNYHKEDSFCSAARFYSEEELCGIDEEDITFELFGFSGRKTDGKKLYVTTITGLDDQAEDYLIFYKEEANEVIKKIKAAIAADDTNGHGRDVYPIRLMETDEGTGYWLYVVRVN